jgi:hypothetical protein
MWVWGIGLLLLGHAFVHAVWRTYGPKVSWILPNASAPSLASLSTTLFILGAVGFSLAGLGLLIHQSWWRPVALVSAVVSLALLVTFWHNGLFVGAAIDLAVLAAILWLRWPTQIFAGP